MKGIDIDAPFGLIVFVMLVLNGIAYLVSMLFGVALPLGDFFHSRLEVVLAGFLIGMLVGKWMEGGRWRANAEYHYKLLFSRGRLYKVKYDKVDGDRKEVKRVKRKTKLEKRRNF